MNLNSYVYIPVNELRVLYAPISIGNILYFTRIKFQIILRIFAEMRSHSDDLDRQIKVADNFNWKILQK